MKDLGQKIGAAIASAAVGVLLGWSANALTLSGRVSAIEAGMVRIEAHLDRIESRRP